jgi:hypothetical protein
MGFPFKNLDETLACTDHKRSEWKGNRLLSMNTLGSHSKIKLGYVSHANTPWCPHTVLLQMPFKPSSTLNFLLSQVPIFTLQNATS